MVWSAPNTAVAGAVWTAAEFNTYVRDNLLTTGPAVHGANTQGYFTQRGLNDIFPARLQAAADDISVANISSGTYVDSAPAGPAVTITTDTTAAVFIRAALADNSMMSFAISGATVRAASDGTRIIRTYYNSGALSVDRDTGFRIVVVSGLTPGSNTFTCKYAKATTLLAPDASFSSRSIAVMPL